jgi:hypothetical protein
MFKNLLDLFYFNKKLKKKLALRNFERLQNAFQNTVYVCAKGAFFKI